MNLKPSNLARWLRINFLPKPKLSDLIHIERQLPGGGNVFVLNDGATINAEAAAMLQSLHSRSVGGFKEHLKTLAEKGAANFISKFYVGYGHKSIGDCGSTTLFIEGVSMLAAKAIQDHALYSGQESSTRYVDFSKQAFIDPTEDKRGGKTFESQRDFYLNLLEPIRKQLERDNPKPVDEKQTKYDSAIEARSFDIARGFLPAGASTNLAWHSNLRQIADHILFLRHHPLAEVRAVADTIEDAVMEAHPNSFSKKRYPETEEYQEVIAESYFYHDKDSPLIEMATTISPEDIAKFQKLFSRRPKKTELPKYLAQLGDVSARFQLDFGSFRDLQRHRSITQRMPLLTPEIGFNEWYMQNLPENLAEAAEKHLEKILAETTSLGLTQNTAQYFMPMGYNTSNSISGDLPAMVYVTELRSGASVHPTLRTVAQQIGRYMEKEFEIPMHLDLTPDQFNIQRGGQTIMAK